MEKHLVIEDFVRKFITKDRRERSLLELTNPKRKSVFAGRLNHDWESVIDSKKLSSIPNEAEEYSFIIRALQISDSELCYVISNYDDLDGEIMEFKKAYDISRGRGFATLLVFENANKIYLKTEQVQGPPNRFTGRA